MPSNSYFWAPSPEFVLNPDFVKLSFVVKKKVEPSPPSYVWLNVILIPPAKYWTSNSVGKLIEGNKIRKEIYFIVINFPPIICKPRVCIIQFLLAPFQTSFPSHPPSTHWFSEILSTHPTPPKLLIIYLNRMLCIWWIVLDSQQVISYRRFLMHW